MIRSRARKDLSKAHNTRPREYRGLRVPDVLLTGDHQRIAAWRKTQAVHATRTQSNKHTEK